MTPEELDAVLSDRPDLNPFEEAIDRIPGPLPDYVADETEILPVITDEEHVIILREMVLDTEKRLTRLVEELRSYVAAYEVDGKPDPALDAKGRGEYLAYKHCFDRTVEIARETR